MYKVGWVYCMEIKTSEGPRIATLGDYIIRRPNGKIYTRRPWTFEKNYEKVEEHEGRQCKIDPRITKDTPVDELILVKNSESDEWQRAHFARMGDEDTVLAWEFGCTSFTASDYFSWEFAKMWEGSDEQKAEEERPSNKGFKGNTYLVDMFLELSKEKRKERNENL